MIDELKHIWKTCFKDEEEYIDFYFSNRYKAEQTFVHYKSEKAVAMLTLLPVSVVTSNKIFSAHYIYAVATLPEFQNQGISSALAAKADEYMRIVGDDLVVVVPATESLFDFYAGQGFSTAFFRRVFSFEMNQIFSTDFVEGIPLNDIDKLYTLREKYFNNENFFVQWDKEALCYVVAECRLSGGEVFYFSKNNQEGYIIVEPIDDKIVVKEIAIPIDLASEVLAFLKRKYSLYKQIQCRLAIDNPLWNDNGTIEPVAMLKWFNHSSEIIDISKAYISLLKD